MTEPLSQVQAFWNETPCDGHVTYADRAQFRYGKDPYLLGVLERIVRTHHNVLEVGCGQGTDGITLSHAMPGGGHYVGVDLSPVSIARAQAAAAEAGPLNVQPAFAVQNAEALAFPDNTFDCVLSVGALHHTPRIGTALAEVRRVLAPGGVAYVFLYRRWSPKVLAAHGLRGAQDALDALLHSERVLYQMCRALKPLERWVGTAPYECFGVPILRSYTRREMETLFREYASVRLGAHGAWWPSLTGYVWLAEAAK